MNAEQLAGLIAEPYRHISEFGYDFPNGLLLAWLTSSADLHLDFDLETDRGADDWTFWWISGGGREFPGIREQLDNEILRGLHEQHLTSVLRPERLGLTPLLSLVHRHRADLRGSMNLDTAIGREKMWYWWLSFGLQEYFNSPDGVIAAQAKALHCLDTSFFRKSGLVPPTAMVTIAWNASPKNQPAVDAETISGSSLLWQSFLATEARLFRLPGRGFPCIPDMPFLVRSDLPDPLKGLIPARLAIARLSRPDLQSAFAPDDPGAAGLVSWWLTAGRNEFPDLRDQIDRDLMQSLHLDFLPDEAAARELTPLLNILRDQRPDLRAQHDVSTPAGIAAFWQWWVERGQREAFGSRFDLSQRKHPAGEATRAPESAPSPTPRERGRKQSSGALDPISDSANNPVINLIGYAKGELGLGEDVRLLHAALGEVNIPNVIINAPWPIIARQSIEQPAIDASVARFDPDVMFYVMPPLDTLRLLGKLGPRAFAARRKIGFWQWEFERFPEPARLAMNLVDEIWCHSEHAAAAFRQATGKSVVKVPLPVSVPEIRSVPRTVFGLPEEAFVVFTSFDGASAIARKNPLAAISAFQLAFPIIGTIDARLILKAMNVNDDPLWRECRRRSLVDKRIMIIDAVMDHGAYYELLKTSDAVISLHRAEGFGRLMAEAMAIGIPVIASRYSGNLDFMTDNNSWLVDGTLIPVLPGDYALHQRQVWLEPDVEKAANALRECFGDEDERIRRAALAMADIASKYSLRRCGETYVKLLKMGPTETLSTA
jgi:glycosyltransferase involved in cell wall biosynthesis